MSDYAPYEPRIYAFPSGLLRLIPPMGAPGINRDEPSVTLAHANPTDLRDASFSTPTLFCL
jgi:hypothetical protein